MKVKRQRLTRMLLSQEDVNTAICCWLEKAGVPDQPNAIVPATEPIPGQEHISAVMAVEWREDWKDV